MSFDRKMQSDTPIHRQNRCKGTRTPPPRGDTGDTTYGEANGGGGDTLSESSPRGRQEFQPPRGGGITISVPLLVMI